MKTHLNHSEHNEHPEHTRVHVIFLAICPIFILICNRGLKCLYCYQSRKKREPFQWDIQYELCPMNVLFSTGLAFLFCFLFRQRKYKQRSRRNIECVGRLHERAHLTIYKCFAFGAIWKFADKTMNGRSKQNDCFHLKRWILLKDIIDFANFSLFVDFSINAQNLNRIGTQFCNGSLFWLIKINGTTLADGCDLNEYHYYGVSLRTCGCNCRAIVESAAHW